MQGFAKHLDQWHPEPLVESDALAPQAAQALAAVLETTDERWDVGQALPPLWHWVYFQHSPAHRALGSDGHPTESHFIPPIPDRRRMFAGGRVEIHEPLTLGRQAERTSEVVRTAVKRGRTGELFFVTVRGEYRQEGALCLVEEQDIVYRSGDTVRSGGPARQAPGQPDSPLPWKRGFTADPVRLFRFSALTANAHRIHYDLPYARDVESYPGLVVHGPLLVLLMGELAGQNSGQRRIRSMSFRLQNPAYVGESLLVAGSPSDGGAARFEVLGGGDRVITQAEVTFERK